MRASPTLMRRSLGRFDITCLGLNAIVGSGIFALPDDLFRELGVLSPLAFVSCAVGLLPIAACYARAASVCEKSGGPYVYASAAFGPIAYYPHSGKEKRRNLDIMDKIQKGDTKGALQMLEEDKKKAEKNS